MESTRREEERISRSAAETVRMGEEFGAQYLRAGMVVCVRGELGAGKTHFIKGIAGSLGIDERELTSPTFALAHTTICKYDGGAYRDLRADRSRLFIPFANRRRICDGAVRGIRLFARNFRGNAPSIHFYDSFRALYRHDGTFGRGRACAGPRYAARAERRSFNSNRVWDVMTGHGHA